jgi:Flp pilus assembly CpaF family ATPase
MSDKQMTKLYAPVGVVACGGFALGEKAAVDIAGSFKSEGLSSVVLMFDCQGVIRQASNLSSLIGCLGTSEIASYAADAVSGLPRIGFCADDIDTGVFDAIMGKFAAPVIVCDAAGSASSAGLFEKIAAAVLVVDLCAKTDWRSFAKTAAQIFGIIKDGRRIGFVHNGVGAEIGGGISKRLNVACWGFADDARGIISRLSKTQESGDCRPVTYEVPSAVDAVLAKIRDAPAFLAECASDRELVTRRVLLELESMGLGGEPCREGEVCSGVWAELNGFGPIDSLMKDAEVSEIMVNGPSRIFIEKAGSMCEVKMGFRDSKHLLSTIDRLVSGVNRRIDELSPMVDARLADGSRLNAVIEPVCLGGPSLTIRKFIKRIDSISALVDQNFLPEDAAEFLSSAVRAKCSMIISGGTGAGKTTLLGALAREIQSEERIITIEDSAELCIEHDNIVRLEARPKSAEHTGEVTIRDLVKNALRMRPDRIIVGECRGAEVLDMLSAMNTGHEGSMTTVHANSARDALLRIETMLMMTALGLPEDGIREQIARSIRIIVQLSRGMHGRRFVSEISEITGREGGVICMQELWRYDSPTGGIVKTGMSPRCLENFHLRQDLHAGH